MNKETHEDGKPIKYFRLKRSGVEGGGMLCKIETITVEDDIVIAKEETVETLMAGCSTKMAILAEYEISGDKWK